MNYHNLLKALTFTIGIGVVACSSDNIERKLESPKQKLEQTKTSPSITYNYRSSENPYAFREENPAYFEFFNGVHWDYSIKVLPGDTLQSIAKEISKRGEAAELLKNNIEVGVLPENFKLRSGKLQPGRRLLIYLPIDQAKFYQTEYPPRDLKKWPHTKDCGAFVGKKCKERRDKF